MYITSVIALSRKVGILKIKKRKENMLDKFHASTVLAASDLERARKFYTEKLGLKEVSGPQGIVMLEAGEGTTIVVYQKEGGPKATNTVLGFEVKDLENLLQELKDKGVEQDMDGLPEGTDESGITHYGSVKSAWIKDSEGNIIGLNEM